VDWVSSRRGFSQIWLQVKEQSKNNFWEPRYVFGKILEAMVKVWQFSLFSLKYGDFVPFLFPKRTFAGFAAFFLCRRGRS